MTPKEKAEELVLKFLRIDINNTKEWFNTLIAKQCALIAIDEILDVYLIKNASFEFYEVRNYWQEVRQEIEKL